MPFDLPNELTLAWIAGFFDGDGCVAVGTNGPSKLPYLSLSVLQISYDDKCPITLEVFHKYLQGKLYQCTDTRKWMWSISGRQAAECLKKLLPYLVGKRAQAELGIQLGELGQQGKALTYDQRSERVRLGAEIKRLKRV